MKKILFVCTRNPYSGRYSGDVMRSLRIINLLKKRYQLDVVCLDSKKNKIEDQNLVIFKSPNFFQKILNCLYSLLCIKPVQFGLFFSKKMKLYLENHANNYECLFFYHVRSSQYLPKNFHGKTILEMGDLYSDNYFQTYKNLNIFNPLKFIYYLESLLIKKAEERIFNNFDKITMFSKGEVKKIKKSYRNKIFQIDESVQNFNKKFFFSRKNNKILFVGNLNYLPNFLACRDFIKEILPKLEKLIPDVKFSIVGSINRFNNFFLPKTKNVEILGSKASLTKYVKNSFCGLANLKIATGVQGKVLTYMSYGLPVICSKKVAENFGSNTLIYKKNSELIQKIIALKTKKKISEKYAKKSIQLSKKLFWKKVSQKYLRLLERQ